MVSGSDQKEVDPANGLKPDVERIIAAGRRIKPPRTGSKKAAAMLAFVSMLLLWLSFTPVEFAPAAWVALVPLILLIRLESLPARCYFWLTVMGFFWGVATLQWMRLGHPAMYGALFALAFYVGLYFPVFVAVSRRIAALGIPVWIVVPFTWTALEYARAWLLTGFSWYYLAHSQFRWLSLIQISDITGAYGVSFVIALANAAVAMQFPLRTLSGWNLRVPQENKPVAFTGQALASAVTAVSLVGGCLIYGVVRIQDPATFGEGPTVALIQGNFTPEVKHDPGSWMQRYSIHHRLTRSCTSLRPTFIVWPETMFPWPDQSVADGVTDEQLIARLPTELLQQGGFEEEQVAAMWRSPEVRDTLADHSKMCGAALILGIEAHVVGATDLQAFNSAAFVRPDLGYVGRYDKIHRVIFGEYIPLKDLFPWLSNLTPFGPNYGIAAGQQLQMFEYAGFNIAPMICFEDTVPHLVRRIAGQKTSDNRGCDVLVNLTNDAWFHGSSELDQHLITAAFRCVETRTPLVRAVNGGISAFVDGNGEVREPDQILEINDNARDYQAQLSPLKGMRDPATGRWRRQFSGIVFGQVPLDPRESLYVRFGDWFAGSCMLFTLSLLAFGLSRRKEQVQSEAKALQ